MRMNNHIIIWVSTFILSLVVNTAQADRVKDLTNVGGVRGNQLVGYGLVVGLAGTGDGKDPTFTGQSLKAILESLGVTTNPYDDYDLAQSRGRPIQVDNVAAVMVTATLPPFAKPGQVVDVNVAALGTATRVLSRWSEGLEDALSASVGIALYDPAGGESVEALFARADSAMYEAKRQGKATFAEASPVGEETGSGQEETDR